MVTELHTGKFPLIELTPGKPEYLNIAPLYIAWTQTLLYGWYFSYTKC